MKRKLILLQVTCAPGLADDAFVAAVAAPGKLDHVQFCPAQPERVPPTDARWAWQYRYSGKQKRDDAYDRVRETGVYWCMKEDRPRSRRAPARQKAD